jgi:hypothetical protein
MRGEVTWRTEQNGELSAALHNLKLIISTWDNCARYVVLQRVIHGGTLIETLLHSGTEPTILAAMVAAIRAATRIESMLAERPKTKTNAAS